MLKVNVGGQVFVTSKNTITTLTTPNYFTSYLEWKPNSNYIFIDRDPKYFDLILNHIRGYTITIPHEEGELYRLYEDANFYGIKSLIDILEERLNISFNDAKRTELRNKIKENIVKYHLKAYSHILTLMDKLSDKELYDILNKTNDEVIRYQNSKKIKILYEGLTSLVSTIGMHLNERDNMLNNLEARKDEAVSFLTMLLDNTKHTQSSHMLLLLFIFSLKN